MKLGVLSSMHLYWTVFSNLNLKTYYPPCYERDIGHYKKANTNHIKKSINGFHWEWTCVNSDANKKRIY